MCLEADTYCTKIIRRRFDRNNKLKFWKVVFIENKRLKGIYQRDYSYKEGINEAEGLILPQNFEGGVYDKGVFHVYRTKKFALLSACIYEVVIPVYCKKEDFVAAGIHEACFRKITIKSTDYKKALKTRSKYGVVGR